MNLTELQIANIRLECIKAAVTNGTKVGLERQNCIPLAQTFFDFVVGVTEGKQPSSETAIE